MKLLTATHRQLLETLRGQLIPWANSGAPFVLLGAPPRVIGSNQMSERPGKALPLKHGNGRIVREQYWFDQNMNSTSVPYFGCVTEGEADLVVGTTTAMCRKMKIHGKRWIIQMPKGSFFLLPPGTPFCGGGDIHWERPHREKAYSRILWMHIHESGGNCHFSTSSKGKLWMHPYLFVHSPQLFPIAHSLINEVQAESPQYISMLYHLLGLLLNHMTRSVLMTPKRQELTEDISPGPNFQQHESVDDLVQRAALYIGENLKDNLLSVERIAAQLHLSPMHLNRIFQRELNSPVKAFVTKRRMELGSKLLQESSFNINQIRNFCGYAHSSSFIKAFMRHFGVSPTEYRSRYQSDVMHD